MSTKTSILCAARYSLPVVVQVLVVVEEVPVVLVVAVGW